MWSLEVGEAHCIQRIERNPVWKEHCEQGECCRMGLEKWAGVRLFQACMLHQHSGLYSKSHRKLREDFEQGISG